MSQDSGTSLTSPPRTWGNYLVMSEEMIRYLPQTFPNGLGRLEFSRQLLAGDTLEDPGVRIHGLRPQNHPSLPLPADTQGPGGGRQDALRAIKVLFASCCSSRTWMSDCTGSPLADLRSYGCGEMVIFVYMIFVRFMVFYGG